MIHNLLSGMGGFDRKNHLSSTFIRRRDRAHRYLLRQIFQEPQKNCEFSIVIRNSAAWLRASSKSFQPCRHFKSLIMLKIV